MMKGFNIEDSANAIKQEHVVTLETPTSNVAGKGEIRIGFGPAILCA
jgi:Flp pilus assembly CpaF family ATPase